MSDESTCRHGRDSFKEYDKHARKEAIKDAILKLTKFDINIEQGSVGLVITVLAPKYEYHMCSNLDYEATAKYIAGIIHYSKRKICERIYDSVFSHDESEREKSND